MASINFHDQHFPISIFFFNLFRKPSKQNSEPAQKDHTKQDYATFQVSQEPITPLW
ncbi:hypothetical protein CROQUDRAFT_98651 [Cronartium quercuum f. sp. fusiforme G11]|uniref:Uncharacterized protein n=1 Tax=Cronartium quercuum f. sp. fusiforme G11 TaxID=708437 RepID=A0A9P6NC93_9BASI|nr:hypothetical protein CROQUDRAFT_98651 [Cronartium quercuum f. sp. fusiforme G11]